MISHRFYPQLMVTYVFFILTLIWSCGKGPTKVDVEGENDPPDTVITQKALSKIPIETDSTGALLNLNSFKYSMEFTGVDLDGKADSFRVKINAGPWSSYSTSTSSSGTLEFASGTATNSVFVQAKDDQGAEDPTPAAGEFTLAEFDANAKPATAFDSAPGNGTATGRGVRFVASGSDEDGQVVNFIYSLDGGSEMTVAADADGKAVIEFSVALGNLLSTGNHSISARSVDNLGAEDATPETRSFFVQMGFQPILTQTAGPAPGGGWFTGAGVPFAWDTQTSHYSGVIVRYEWSVDDPVNFTAITTGAHTLEPQSAGAHIFRVRAVDLEGNLSEDLTVDFEVAAFVPTEGILFIDNVSFTPGGGPYSTQEEMDQMILDGFFKNFSQVDVWDSDNLSGGNRFSGAINSINIPGPADLAKYSSVVIMTDGGAGDGIGPWEAAPLLAAYFQAGGNILTTGYRISAFNGSPLISATGLSSISGSRGSDFQSLEGFATAGSRESDAYSFISGADVVPIVPGVDPRDWERPNNTTGAAFRILFSNVGASGSRQGQRIAAEFQGAGGSWSAWIGVSMFYLDQTSTGIVKLGDFILGDRFGEVKN